MSAKIKSSGYHKIQLYVPVSTKRLTATVDCLKMCDLYNKSWIKADDLAVLSYSNAFLDSTDGERSTWVLRDNFSYIVRVIICTERILVEAR